MKEIESYFRYTIPGLVFFIELILLLLFSGDLCFNQLGNIVKDLSITITALISSGGIGFLFGIFHYILIQKTFLLVNFQPFIDEAVDKKWLILVPLKNTMNIRKKISYYWITFSLWNSNIDNSKEIKESNGQVLRLANIANSLGTIFISTIFALLI